jgi:hypothetical protein
VPITNYEIASSSRFAGFLAMTIRKRIGNSRRNKVRKGFLTSQWFDKMRIRRSFNFVDKVTIENDFLKEAK